MNKEGNKKTNNKSTSPSKNTLDKKQIQDKVKTLTILKVIAIIMLLWALADNDYCYYQLLRWVVAGIMGYSAYFFYRKGENNWTWILAIIAILFNPIIPFYLDREVWILLDIIAATVIFISIFKLKVVVQR